MLARETVERVLAPPGAPGVDGSAHPRRRFAFINVWRNRAEEAVQRAPLALCDAQGVAPSSLVTFELRYADRTGENYFSKHEAGQKWFYYPRIERDEALLIKQWDSHGGLARSAGARSDVDSAAAGGVSLSTFSFHSAFELPATPEDAPDRESIEVRCVVVYDDDAAAAAARL